MKFLNVLILLVVSVAWSESEASTCQAPMSYQFCVDKGMKIPISKSRQAEADVDAEALSKDSTTTVERTVVVARKSSPTVKPQPEKSEPARPWWKKKWREVVDEAKRVTKKILKIEEPSEKAEEGQPSAVTTAVSQEASSAASVEKPAPQKVNSEEEIGLIGRIKNFFAPVTGTAGDGNGEADGQGEGRKSLVEKEPEALPSYTRQEKGVDKEKLEEIRKMISEQVSIGRIENLNLKDVQFSMPEFSFLEGRYQAPQALPSPKVGQWDKASVEKANAKVSPSKYEIPKNLRVQKTVSARAVNRYKVPSEEIQILQLHDVPSYTDEQVHHLIGQLLIRTSKCHLAVGLLLPGTDEIVDCLFDMGLYAQSLEHLEKWLKTRPKDLTVLKKWLSKAPSVLREDLGERLNRMKDLKLDRRSSRSQAHYYQSLYHLSQKNHGQAIAEAKKVHSSSEDYLAALLIRSLLQKNTHRLDEEIIDKVSRGQYRSSERSIALAAAAGIAFQRKKFSQSIKLFQQLNKEDHNWVDSLIQLGWSQLLNKDFKGAVGNMYSLHTPIFQEVYLPESFVVRTIGYLSICQYGDAYRTLSFLEEKYRPWLAAMRANRQQKPTEKQYFGHFVEFLDQGVKGKYGPLPHEVVRELTRQKEVIHLKKKVVNATAQIKQYDFLLSFLDKELTKEKKRAFKPIKDETGKVLRHDSRGKTYQDRYDLIVKSIDQFKGMRKDWPKVLAKKNSDYELQIGSWMKGHLATLEKQLQQILDNNEFLRFEVFSASGENLRALQQGAVKQKRVHRSVRPKNKGLSWAFTGEMWLDEIGHYRSSLKNNCADRVTASIPSERSTK